APSDWARARGPLPGEHCGKCAAMRWPFAAPVARYSSVAPWEQSAVQALLRTPGERAAPVGRAIRPEVAAQMRARDPCALRRLPASAAAQLAVARLHPRGD